MNGKNLKNLIGMMWNAPGMQLHRGLQALRKKPSVVQGILLVLVLALLAVLLVTMWGNIPLMLFGGSMMAVGFFFLYFRLLNHASRFFDKLLGLTGRWEERFFRCSRAYYGKTATFQQKGKMNKEAAGGKPTKNAGNGQGKAKTASGQTAGQTSSENGRTAGKEKQAAGKNVGKSGAAAGKTAGQKTGENVNHAGNRKTASGQNSGKTAGKNGSAAGNRQAEGETRGHSGSGQTTGTSSAGQTEGKSAGKTGRNTGGQNGRKGNSSSGQKANETRKNSEREQKGRTEKQTSGKSADETGRNAGKGQAAGKTSGGSEKKAGDPLTEAQSIFNVRMPYSVREIKDKRNLLLKKYHPDNLDGSEEMCKKINMCYDLLERYAEH